MKLVISESEKNHILGLYGLLEQQAIQNNPDEKIIPTNAGKYGEYKPTQQDLKIFNYPQGFPNLKAKDGQDWLNKASIYLGSQLELVKYQKGWSVTPCDACSTTITGSLAKDIANKKLCVNSSLLAKKWKCPEGMSFYSVMARDYNTVDYTKMYNLVKTAPTYKDEFDRFVEKVKELGWNGFFEKLREAMNSVAGVGAQVVLDSFGFGTIAVEAVWGLLLGWDLYMYKSKGELNWIDFLTDLAGLITFGPGAKMISNAFKAVSETKGSFKIVVEYIAKNPQAFEWITKANFEGLFVQISKWLKILASKFKTLEPIILAIEKFVESTNILKKAVVKMVEEIGGDEIKSGVTYVTDKITPGGGKVAKVTDKVSKLTKATTGG